MVQTCDCLDAHFSDLLILVTLLLIEGGYVYDTLRAARKVVIQIEGGF